MKDDIRAGILGAADGVVSISGVVAGGVGAHLHHMALAHTATAGGLAAVVSMAGAEMLSESRPSWRSILYMAVGTAVGGVLPFVPLFFGSDRPSYGRWIAVCIIALAVCLVVAEVRYRSRHVIGAGRLASVGLTLGVVGVAGCIGYAVG